MKNNQTASRRHAYLILAHKDDLSFRTLITLLDDSRNDIFIHMDKKNINYNEQEIMSLPKKSRVFMTPRVIVSWGAYNLVNAEILLLKEATRQDHYAYYHLLSGQDLPIKTQDYIHNFFDENQGKEFVCFQNPSFEHMKRVRYYYPLQDKYGKKSSLSLRLFNEFFPFLQKMVGIHRNKNISFQKGTEWFSITDDLARYVVQKEPWIKKIFKDTLCPDEVFLHTVIINSDFKNNLYHKKFDDDCRAAMRLIDWNRGKPYVFRNTDLGDIKKSDCLFVRKIDAAVDEKIISNIRELAMTPEVIQHVWQGEVDI
ncbi:glycosyl transferase [Candidatus Saccharibacteria bacterium]|nr:glycosyl transferase [Candidatus Saccharibacteria bacterium]